MEGCGLRCTYHDEGRVYHSSLDSVNASQVQMLYFLRVEAKAVAEAVVNHYLYYRPEQFRWRGLAGASFLPSPPATV